MLKGSWKVSDRICTLPEIQHRYPKLLFLRAVTFSKAHHFGALQPLVFGSVPSLKLTVRALQRAFVPCKGHSKKNSVLEGKSPYFRKIQVGEILLPMEPTSLQTSTQTHRRSSIRSHLLVYIPMTDPWDD